MYAVTQLVAVLWARFGLITMLDIYILLIVLLLEDNIYVKVQF